jgi:hypothetical protein
MATPYRLRAHRPTSQAVAVGVLGPIVRSFSGAANRNVVWAAAPFVLLLGYGVWLAHQGLLLHWFNSTFSVFAVAFLFVASISLIVHTAAGGGGDVVRVHANGLLDLRVGPRAVRWDEIQSLTAVLTADRQAVDHHVLLTADGATLTLGPSIGGVDELVDEIRARIAEHALPEIRARIADGEAVHFGAMTASDAGIRVGEAIVAWADVAEIEADAGEVVVRGKGGLRVAAAPLAEVPNAFLLAEMAHDRRKA